MRLIKKLVLKPIAPEVSLEGDFSVLRRLGACISPMLRMSESVSRLGGFRGSMDEREIGGNVSENVDGWCSSHFRFPKAVGDIGCDNGSTQVWLEGVSGSRNRMCEALF